MWRAERQHQHQQNQERLTLHVAENVRADEGQDDDGHGQGIVGQHLPLVGIEVWPDGARQ